MDAPSINAELWTETDPHPNRFDQNPKVMIQDSPIHGQGVFARVDIPAFSYIGHYAGPITQHDGMHVLWLFDDDSQQWYGVDGTNEMRFLNHADQPNAEWSGLDLYATEFIPAGTEITFDYGWDDDDENIDENDHENDYENDHENDHENIDEIDSDRDDRQDGPLGDLSAPLNGHRRGAQPSPIDGHGLTIEDALPACPPNEPTRDD